MAERQASSESAGAGVRAGRSATFLGIDTRAVTSWIMSNPVLFAGMLAIFLPTMFFVARSSWSTEQGGHGPIVLATGLWLFLQQWPLVTAKPVVPPVRKTLLVFVPLLIAYFAARVSKTVELEAYFMYGLLLVVLYSFVGSRFLKQLWFPLFYMLFVFPPPQTVIDAVTNPLKVWLSVAAVNLLYALGYPIAGAGVTIQIGQYELLVAAACSGLNSLISLTAISLFYVYLRHQAEPRYAFLLLVLVVPVALFANFIRVLILVLLTYYGGEAVAQGFLHDFAGLTMFVTALLSIFALDAVLMPVYQRLRGRTVGTGG